MYVTVSASFASFGGGAANGLSLGALAAGLSEAPAGLLGVLCPQAANSDIHKTRQRISDNSFLNFCITKILLTFCDLRSAAVRLNIFIVYALPFTGYQIVLHADFFMTCQQGIRYVCTLETPD
jgi:hypothetical protein